MTEQELALSSLDFFDENEFIVYHLVCDIVLQNKGKVGIMILLTNKYLNIVNVINDDISVKKVKYSDINHISELYTATHSKLTLTINNCKYSIGLALKEDINFIKEELIEFNKYEKTYGELFFEDCIDNEEYISSNMTSKNITTQFKIKNVPQKIQKFNQPNNSLHIKEQLYSNKGNQKKKSNFKLMILIVVTIFILSSCDSNKANSNNSSESNNKTQSELSQREEETQKQEQEKQEQKEKEEKEKEKQKMIEDFKLNMIVFAKEYCRQNLVAPSTAKFPWKSPEIKKAKSEREGYTIYVLDSYVDSQNRFGAMLRTKYRFIMEVDDETMQDILNMEFKILE